jgi:4-hydroxybenzoate polyprenyltransferase
MGSPIEKEPPLCVDLDGTLLKSDLLIESALMLVSKNPLYAFLFVAWLFGGKAKLKREIAARVVLTPETLPWDHRLLDELRRLRGERRLVLCTAADRAQAEQVADHLGLFDEVLASDGRTNFAGHNKSRGLCERFGERGFDYAGNAWADLSVWRRARRGWVVNAPAGLLARARRECEIERCLSIENGGWRIRLRAIRVHQWLKNLLVFVPLLAAHRFLEPAAAAKAIAAFVAFSLCASGVYLLNDLLDLPADRRHPRKRLRPFASGSLPLHWGLTAAPLLVSAAFALAYAAEPWLAAALAIYFAATTAYSLALKRWLMIDVVVLAGLYTLRIIGGAAAIGSPLSFWLLAFSMFVFLSLAMLKRYAELATLHADGQNKASGRGYAVEDLPLLQSLGSASGYLAVLVLALYINSPESTQLYRHPKVLWLLCPMLLYWMSWVWVAAHRGRMNDDPIVFAATDGQSRLVMAICAAIALGAM